MCARSNSSAVADGRVTGERRACETSSATAWPAGNALLGGTTCPAWPESHSVAIAGTSYGGGSGQWIQVDLGSIHSVAEVKYYGKTDLSPDNNPTVELLDGPPFVYHTCNTSSSALNVTKSYDCRNMRGRYVQILRSQSRSDGTNWHFCRIKITDASRTELTGEVTSSSEYCMCLDPTFPHRLGIFCYTHKSYVIANGGPCDSWCTTDTDSGDFCSGCCGNISLKVCQAPSRL